jgi:hypothetical protein
MSIANLRNPTNTEPFNIYCGDLNLDKLILAQTPVIDNSQNNFLVRDPITGLTKVNDSVGSGSITGATSLGSGSAIYQGESGSTLQFNSLLGTSGNILVSSPIGGSITLNIDSNVATLSSSQTITGTKTFSNPPIISQITNTGTLTLPTTTGTLALVSQIPSLTNYVDLTSNQSITGIKTFLGAPVISTITNTGILTLPTTTGTLALVSQIPSLTNYVDLSSNQSITGVKTFSTAPVISSITNTGTLTLPITTGTLALVSQIPTNSTYVDLSTNQTITGIKTFSGAPVISTITNTGTLTLPTTTGTIALVSQIPTTSTYVDLTSNQSITGTKTFSTAPIITTINNSGTITIPTGTNTLANISGIQTFLNKTIDSGSNSISVSGTAITSIISSTNTLLTTSTPQFARLGLGVASDQAYLLTNDATQNDKIVIWRGGVVNSNQFFGFGLGVNMLRYQVNNSSSDHVFYCGASTTTSTEIFRVKGTGGITLPTTGGTASIFNYFETGTIVFTFTGPPASGTTFTASFQRSGNQVTLYLPAVSVTATTSTFFSSGVTMAPRIVPLTNQSFPIFVQDSSTQQTVMGKVDVLTTGAINIYKAAPSISFSATLNCGWTSSTFTWLIA